VERWWKKTGRLVIDDEIVEFNAQMAAARDISWCAPQWIKQVAGIDNGYTGPPMVNLSKWLNKISKGHGEIRLIRELQEKQLVHLAPRAFAIASLKNP
jgi:hypothetical protein